MMLLFDSILLFSVTSNSFGLVSGFSSDDSSWIFSILFLVIFFSSCNTSLNSLSGVINSTLLLLDISSFVRTILPINIPEITKVTKPLLKLI